MKSGQVIPSSPKPKSSWRQASQVTALPRQKSFPRTHLLPRFQPASDLRINNKQDQKWSIDAISISGWHDVNMMLSWYCHDVNMMLSWYCHDIVILLSWGCHDVVMMRMSRWSCHEVVMRLSLSWSCHEVIMRLSWGCHIVSNWCYFHKWWHTPWLKVEMLSHLKSLMMKIYLHILPATVIGNVAEGFPLAVVARIPVLIQKRGYLIKKN